MGASERVIEGFLCYYDPRNPDYSRDPEDEEPPREPAKDCYCDNCFYSRTALAEEILQLREQVKELSSNEKEKLSS